MIRVCQRLINFTIVSNKIAHSELNYKKDHTVNLYPVVGFKDIKLGSISLNQANNQNFFTVQMMDQLYRFLTTYTHDHTIENVWIQNKGSMFMGGISYQQLYQNPDYLDKMYKMTALFARFNKPTFSCATGGVRNVGAYVLSMATIALTDYTASLRIDQVSKGFIPVAGGSHTLSRLPAKIGFYLALTGRKLDSIQMSRLGFITAIKKQQVSPKQIRKIMSRSNLFFRQRLNVRYNDKTDSEFVQWNKILEKHKTFNNQIRATQHQIITGQNKVFSRFAMNQFKIEQINYENAVRPWNSFTSRPGRTINNYYLMRHQKAFKALQKQGFAQKSHYQDFRLPGFEVDKILKIFGQDNILQAIKLLQNDSSEWAKQTLQQIRKMDPLAATLTFELLKRAQDLSWDQCLDLEYTVAKRLLSNSKLSLKQTYGGSKSILINKYSSQRIQQISIQNTLQQYFSSALNNQQKLQLDVPFNSILPTNNYIDIPDSVRCALNKQLFNDIHIGNQDRQFKRWLQNQKIDYRNKSYNIDLLRQKIYNKRQYQFILSNQSKRIQYLMNNSSVYRKFIQQKYSYIDNMSDQQLNNYLNQNIKIIFNQGIKSKFQDFNQTAQIIGKQNKLNIFKHLRKYLINKVVINGLDIQAENQQNNQMFHGQVYFNQNGKDILSTKNPKFSLHQPLQKMTQQISQNMKLDQDFINGQGKLPKQRHLTVQRQKRLGQVWLQRIQKNISQRYQQSPQAWNRAYQYQLLVKQAGQTSSDLANYLQWTSTDFYNLIMNNPQTPKTYNDLGQQIINKIKQKRQIQKDTLRTQTILSQTLSKQYFQQLYKNQPIQYKSSKYIKQNLLEKFSLNKQIQKFLTPILQQVLKHFQEKYYVEKIIDKKLEFGQFDQYIYKSIDKNFLEVYKNDILFVYSYFTILKVKDVLHNLKLNNIQQNNKQQYHRFFKQYGIQFLADRNIKFMNRILSKLLFKMLDIHTYTKPKIKLPQNKLLDFLNRIKINKQIIKNSNYPLSFQSILLMIGKDRSKIYNKLLHQYIPTEPQYLLESAKRHSNDLKNKRDKRSDQISIYHLMQNIPSQQYKQQKQLIAGYPYYLGLFDSFIQRVSGKYNFCNDYLLSLDKIKLKKQLSDILNLKQTNQQWFNRINKIIIKQIFDSRIQYQKNMTKGQLYAFDQQFRQIFTPQIYRLLIKFYVQSQLQSTKQLFKKTRHYNYQINDSDINQQKYCQIRRNVKNPDAFKRLNNLRMAMKVQHQYILQSQKNQVVGQQQKLDLVQQKKQFGKYQRFPRQTYRRIKQQTFSYGQQKNFDKYLYPLKDRQMDHNKYINNIRFESDQQQFNIKKQQKFTQFQQQLKQLKNTILKNKTDNQIDSVYKKIQQLL